jgi:signal transduction histidine kinase
VRPFREAVEDRAPVAPVRGRWRREVGVNVYGLIPLVAVIAYWPLLVLALRQPSSRVLRAFGLYLCSAMVWSFGSFKLHANFVPQWAFFWTGFLTVVFMAMAVTYYRFVSVFTGRPSRLVVSLGYLSLPVIAWAISQGHMLKHAVVVDGVLYHDWGLWLVGITLEIVAFAGGAALLLGRYYRELQEPSSRTRVIYLLVGLAILSLFGLSNFVPGLARFPVDHLGNLLNAVLISYAILRHRLLEIHVALRRGLAALIAAFAFLSAYFLTLLLLQAVFHLKLGYTTVSAVTGVFVALVAILGRPTWSWAQERAERLFFPGTYEYRRLLVTFTRRMGDVLDLEELATHMLHPITRALGSSRACLFLTDGRGDVALRFAYPQEGEPPYIRFRRDSPIVEWLTREEKPLDWETIQIKPEFKSLWLEEQSELGQLNLTLLCPLMSKGNLIGVLGLGQRASRGPYTQDDVDLLMTMATEAALTVENARMVDELKREHQRVARLLAQTVRAQEEERKRVSVELHDSVAQWLVGALYGIQALQAQLARTSNGTAQAELQEIRATTEASIRELRAVMAGLHPPDLEEMGFVPALRQTVEQLGRDGVVGRFHVEGTPIRLPPDAELALFRIVQESIHNIRKHAGASQASVALRFGADQLHLEITDDGKGFDLARTLESGLAAGHMGLHGMRHRAESLGATVEVQSARGKGTKISLIIPLPKSFSPTQAGGDGAWMVPQAWLEERGQDGPSEVLHPAVETQQKG